MSGVLRSVVAKSRTLPLRQAGRRFIGDDQDLVAEPVIKMNMFLKGALFFIPGWIMWYPMIWWSVNTENFKVKTWTWTGAWTKETYENQINGVALKLD